MGTKALSCSAEAFNNCRRFLQGKKVDPFFLDKNSLYFISSRVGFAAIGRVNKYFFVFHFNCKFEIRPEGNAKIKFDY